MLEELVKLANIQDERVLALREEERNSGFINPRLDAAISLHKKLLLSILEIRFDLGLDPFLRRTPEEQLKALREKDELAQKHLYEAYTAAEKIFERRLGKTGRLPGFEDPPASAEISETSADSAPAEEDGEAMP